MARKIPREWLAKYSRDQIEAAARVPRLTLVMRCECGRTFELKPSIEATPLWMREFGKPPLVHGYRLVAESPDGCPRCLNMFKEFVAPFDLDWYTRNGPKPKPGEKREEVIVALEPSVVQAAYEAEVTFKKAVKALKPQPRDND